MTKRPSPTELIAALDEVIAALEAGATPLISDVITTAFYCFNPEVLTDDPDIKPADLSSVFATLGAGDLPTFKRARAAVENREQAWLGFKIVTDSTVVCDSEDTAVMGISGEGQGSADALSGVFFVADDKQIIFSREYSRRDRKQMLDITQGPHMHNRQYAGVAWTSIELEPKARIIMFGAGDVSAQLAVIARLIGFETLVIDYDEDYLNEVRFPTSERIRITGFDEIPDLNVGFDDYLCVLTRGHMHDPEAIAYAVHTPAGYIGMMGNPMKNERVYSLVEERGVDRSLLEADRLYAPIGFKFGGKTPPELAISICAQLIKIRDSRRKSHD